MTETTEISSVRKLLVLAPNWLGDTVMMTPLLNFLADAENYSDNNPPQITLGIRNSWAPLFVSDPRVNSLVLFDRHGRHGGLKGLIAQAKIMAKDDYDAVIMCPPSLRVGLASWLAGIPRRIGFASDGRAVFLTTRVKKKFRGTIHYSNEMLSLGHAFLGRYDEPALTLESALPGCKTIPGADVGYGPPIWVMAPGTTYGQAKTWPSNRVVDFIDSAVTKFGVRLLLLGDEQTRTFVDQLHSTSVASWRKDLPGAAGIVDLTGRTNLTEVVSLLKVSSAFVGNDSGLMHLAGALEVPTVGLFGSSNPDWTAPLGRNTQALSVQGFSCRPCYRKVCNQKEFCLEKLLADEVMAAVENLLKENM